MQKSEFIDYARGFSILTIVVFHLTQGLALPQSLRYVFSFGGAGVHLFFFASGYGLAKSKYTTFVDFLKRRLNKVLVPYYITVTLIFLANLLIKIYPVGVQAYLSHIFLYKMFIPKYEESLGAQLWFISTIIQFYLIFPLLLWFLKAERYKVFFTVALILSLGYSLAVALTPYANERVLNGSFMQYLWEFALGMVIARTDTLDKILNKPISYYIIVIALSIPITALLVLKGGNIGKNMNDVFVFAAYTSIVVLLYRIVKPLNKFVLWVTGFSYALYLTHLFVFNWLYNAGTKSILGNFTMPILFLVIIVFSYGYNFLLIKITDYRAMKSPILHKS